MRSTTDGHSIADCSVNVARLVVCDVERRTCYTDSRASQCHHHLISSHHWRCRRHVTVFVSHFTASPVKFDDRPSSANTVVQSVLHALHNVPSIIEPLLLLLPLLL